MSIVNDILSAQQGRYEWGRRDCLTTAAALMEGLRGEPCGVDLSKWHALLETRALAKVRREYGGYGPAVSAQLEGVEGVDALAGDTALLPGDIAWLEGGVLAAGEAWDTRRWGGVLGFAGDSHELFVFARPGLTPAQGDYRIERIFRCRPR